MPTAEATHRFHVGERVRVMQANPAGNPRTPAYVRGKEGIVTALHGSIQNPLDHRGVYPPLCSVVFPVGEVFGGASQDTLARGLASARWDRGAKSGWMLSLREGPGRAIVDAPMSAQGDQNDVTSRKSVSTLRTSRACLDMSVQYEHSGPRPSGSRN